MPIETPIYGLEAFVDGDFYYSVVDKRRFLILDNQLAFITDRVGDGRISGWAVTDARVDDVYSDLAVTVSSGIGIINRFATYTYGSFTVNLTDNRTSYLYMRRKNNIVGGFSGFSDLVSETVVDETAPSIPTALSINPEFNSNEISWDANSETDLSHYVLYRSSNNIDFSELSTISGSTSYTDSDLDQNTNYYYKISAVDLSDNASAQSTSVIGKTLKDTRQPVPPGSVQAFPLNGAMQLFWNQSESPNVGSYTIRYQQLNDSLDPIGPQLTKTIGSDKTFAVIPDLVNSESYEFTIFAVNINGVASTGIKTIAVPIFNDGPPEVEDIDVDFLPGDNDDIDVIMRVSFSPTTNEYLIPADRYFIVLLENTTLQSREISVLDGETSRDIRVVPFDDGSDGIAYRSIQTETRYLVQVIGVDTEGNRSNGVIAQTFVPTFKEPPPPSNLSLSLLDDFSLRASWRNSATSVFDYTELTVESFNTITQSTTTIADAVNVERATSYLLDESFVQPSRTFTFTLRAFDIYGNVSDSIVATFSTDEDSDGVPPGSPTDISTSTGNRQVSIKWEPLDTDSIVNVNVYRARWTLFPAGDDFALIATLPGGFSQYIDYEVDNGIRYMYVITAVDRNGLESLGPADGNFTTYTFQTALPSLSGSLTEPENVSIAQSGLDAVIEWDVSGGDFDGYEVYRSIGNKYSFAPVDTTDPATTMYVDEDVFLTDGQIIYYMVRKFRNEAEPFLTESATPPTGSTILAIISTSGGTVSIDETPAVELFSLEDPIRTETQSQLNLHKHNIDSQGNDKRINLQSDIKVSDFTSFDYKSFTTETDIGGADSYILTVEGEVNEDFFTDSEGNKDELSIDLARRGIPPFLFEVDEDAGRIVFEQQLFGDAIITIDNAEAELLRIIEEVKAKNLSLGNNADSSAFNENLNAAIEQILRLGGVASPGNVTDPSVAFGPSLNQAIENIRAAADTISFTEGAIRPYLTEPVVSIRMVGIVEVDDTLPANRIENISATQVSTGLLREVQLPTINHDGRVADRLIPEQSSLSSDDKFTYFFLDGKTIDDTVTFYDVEEADDDELLAATSRGVLRSTDFGNIWTPVYRGMLTAPHRIFHASSIGKFLALTNRAIYISSGTFNTWNKMTGFENVKTIRDIVEDSDGNLYVSTDLGVYKLDIQSDPNANRWDQLSLFGPRSSEAYGMFYDMLADRIVVSNELGLLESLNKGLTWSFTSEFSEFKQFFAFDSVGTIIFGVTRNEVWRKKGSGAFERIAQLDIDEARLLKVYQDRIYVSTDEGAFVSKLEDDIYTASAVDFQRTLPEININNNAVPATSFSRVGNVLFVGTDKRLYVTNGSSVWLQYENVNGASPSVYLNSVEQKIGWRFNALTSAISFDEKQDVNAAVSIATSYDKFNAESTGWASQKYDSRVRLRVNSAIVFDTDNLDNGIPLDIDNFTSFEFPSFNVINSHSSGAVAEQTGAENAIRRLRSIVLQVPAAEGTSDIATLDDGETLSDAVADVYIGIDRFQSQIYPEIRAAVEEYPQITVPITGLGSYEVVKGSFAFNAPYTKYDNLTVDVLGATIRNIGDNTHREIEDIFEDINSGLPSSLSRVQQVNIAKYGVHFERESPGLQSICAPPYNARFHTPDTSHWYDRLNSTVDWEVQSSQTDVTPVIPYAATAIYISSQRRVLVGGFGGALSIDIDTLEIDYFTIGDEQGDEIIKQFYEKNDVIYAVTSRNVFTSSDATTWTEVLRIGLPSSLFSIAVINNTIVVGADDGIYFFTGPTTGWSKAIEASEPVEIMTDPDLVFAVVGNSIYSTADGANWRDSGELSVNINSIEKLNALHFVATDEGLYKDDGTFYSGSASVSLENILGITTESADLVVNDVVATDIRVYAGMDNAELAYLDEGGWAVLNTISLETIQKILVVEDELWIFGNDRFVIMTGPINEEGDLSNDDFSERLEMPVRLTTGAPGNFLSG